MTQDENRFTEDLVLRTRKLRDDVEALSFSYDGYIYDPLVYAWDMHEAFLRRYIRQDSEILMLGMNPGPFGMMQTGVPFGEVNAVRDYLKLDLPVGSPVRGGQCGQGLPEAGSSSGKAREGAPVKTCPWDGYQALRGKRQEAMGPDPDKMA